MLVPTCKFTKKNSFTHPPSCILPSFSQNASRLLLPKRFCKCVSTISFRKYKRKVVLLVIYLLNNNSSKWTFLHVEYRIDVVFLGYGFYQINWSSSFLAIQRCVFWYVHFYKNLIVLYPDDTTFIFYFGTAEKKAITEKPWQIMLHDKTISS